MNLTIQTERYAVARPLDRFARNFINYLDDLIYINDAIDTQSTKYLSHVKVYDTTDRFWAWLLDTRERRMAVGDPHEYSDPPPREDIDGISIGPVVLDRKTGQRYFLPVEIREICLRNTFPRSLAREFAPYDALIFIHRTQRWAQRLRPEMLPHATKTQFDAAKKYTIRHAPYRVVAHECTHLIQKITGGEMPTWDPASDLDPAERLYDDYLLTNPVFDAIYLHDDGLQADKIDL